mgnify:CR=1 FL=1
MLAKLAEYKPLAKIEEIEEQNYNMIDDRLNNGVEKFNREEEKKEQVEKPWIFYQEGEKVIEHGPNPYLALYYVKTENRKEMDLLTEEFYEEMHILDPNGQEVAYHNQIPDYAPAEK